ncbi:hypothetical protein EDC94DRAFT_612768 [Helicostylum pulchrum]|nr:hypothetical protein EDC94DRAFT_612768 [Helicostylum pulchrum]
MKIQKTNAIFHVLLLLLLLLILLLVVSPANIMLPALLPLYTLQVLLLLLLLFSLSFSCSLNVVIKLFFSPPFFGICALKYTQ